ncbi:MAG: hypothetical protein KGZ97_00350 [Bacteroidetes bacterium]|nr:hypothetical protein [Bacteroidota bacterium]
MQIPYNISLSVKNFLFTIKSLYNREAKLRKMALRDVFLKMELEVSDANDEQLIWFHCNSDFEFEQALPVVEKLNEIFPEKRILVTSNDFIGRSFCCGNAAINYFFILPLDKVNNAKIFLNIWKPSVAVFVNNTFPSNYIKELNEQHIPIVAISSTFYEKKLLLGKAGKWNRQLLGKISYFFVQNKESLNFLNSLGINNAILSGDTLFDKSYRNKEKPKSLPLIENFIQGSIVFVFGNVAENDKNCIVSLINQGFNGIKFIVVGNNNDNKVLSAIESGINGKVVRLSDKDHSEFPEAQVLLVDDIKLLQNIYQYASIAYVGGGFGNGVKNISDAAAFGMPVLFGPNYNNKIEAIELVKYGGAFCVNNAEEIISVSYKILSNYELLKKISEVSKEYVRLKKGAADKIITFLQALLNTSRDIVRRMQQELNMN